jgi:putative oxidoreductase|tara:strand:- start:1 stop:501 length:501 start_codon:yes stop_codon:yes gene_type:complete
MLGKINSLFENIAENSQDWTWTLFRVLSAAMFMTHGYGKLFGENPQPFMGGGITTINIAEIASLPIPMEINALFITGVVEFFGGLLILIGLWTHLAALLATFIMLMAYLTAHYAWFPTLNNGELAAMYFTAFLVIFAFGPGPCSADSWLAIWRQEKRKDKMDKNKL